MNVPEHLSGEKFKHPQPGNPGRKQTVHYFLRKSLFCPFPILCTSVVLGPPDAYSVQRTGSAFLFSVSGRFFQQEELF